MQYARALNLPDRDAEDDFILSYPPQLEMQCYDGNNVYPFKIFPDKGLRRLPLSPLTLLYGGNGSGKSTLLHLLAGLLQARRTSPFAPPPCFAPYLALCSVDCPTTPPGGSRYISSDDVFDFLLDLRAVNAGIERRRQELFAEYENARDPTQPSFRMRSLDQYEELRRRNDARLHTKSRYTAARIKRDLPGRSNGESALAYFENAITQDTLYLLDEPENSLSAPHQQALAEYIHQAMRFYGCQFVLATHSPFFLALPGAVVWNLDARPAAPAPWATLPNVRVWADFFRAHAGELGWE